MSRRPRYPRWNEAPPGEDSVQLEQERFRRKAREHLRRLIVQARRGDEDARRLIQDLERARGGPLLTDQDAVALLRVRLAAMNAQATAARPDASPDEVERAEARLQDERARLRRRK